MSFVFKMPEVGEGVVEAEVTEWKVAVGDRVQVDQPLCEITTDKASVEISSPRAGVVTKLFGAPGDIVRVHTPLVELDTSGAGAGPEAPAKAAQAATAEAPKGPAAAGAATVATPTAGDLPREPEAEAPAPEAQAQAQAPTPRAPRAAAPAAAAPRTNGHPAPAGEVKAAPAVRRRARELGVDLRGIEGTGPGGRVTHADLDRGPVSPVAAEAKVPPALPQVTPAAEDTVVKIVGVRRKIAERMVAAKTTAPHFTYVEEVDCTKLVAFREALKGQAAARGVKLTYLPFFAKACSLAFRDFPNVNAWMDTARSELVVKAAHHLGFACDTPSGLVVPVVRHVEQKSILQIASELQDLFGRCREGRCTREELVGSTFTITGVGNIGGTLATPILNVPEVGILGVNEIKKRAVVIDDRVEVRPTTFLSNSFDHRIVDGAVAARFTARVKALIETPESLLLELA